MPARPLSISVILLLATAAAGLAIRFVLLGLPIIITKYGGSFLWALMLYWIVSTLLLSRSLSVIVLLAGVLATAVEFFKLYHSPAMDAFRLTLPGILLFGRFFSAWDILVYWIAIILGSFLDKTIRQRGTS